jgi:uncharacterized membrane protein YfbV (UPF0208 family)
MEYERAKKLVTPTIGVQVSLFIEIVERMSNAEATLENIRALATSAPDRLVEQGTPQETEYERAKKLVTPTIGVQVSLFIEIIERMRNAEATLKKIRALATPDTDRLVEQGTPQEKEYYVI